MFSVSQQGLRGDELGGDPLCFVMEHLGVADLGRLGKTCRRLRDAVDESGFEHLRLVRKIRSARKDPAGNVYVCVYSK